MKVSAVVCTRNRADMVKRAIESLRAQDAPRGSYEIVVIDNGSTDDTKEVVSQFPDVRYVYEPRTGIAHARNTGFEAAAGKYVAYIDDDAAAEPDWVSGLLRNFEVEEPPISVGGQILPLYEVPKPEWFLDEYEARSWGGVRRALAKGESFSASNMCIRRDALIDVEGFPTDVGMDGERLMVGEEPLLYERLWARWDCSDRIIYDPSLCVRHSVPAIKMRLSAMARRKFVAGQFIGRVGRKRGRGRWSAAVRALASVIVKCFAALVHVFRAKSFHRWVFEGAGMVAEPLARFLALLGIEPRLRRS